MIRMHKCAVVELAVISTKEKCLIVDRGNVTYVGELGCVFKPPTSIHIPSWCVMEFPVQWDVEVEILGLLF